MIALAPSGGVLADAIGVELVNRGYNVVDTQETTNLLTRMNLDEMEVMQPQRITQLRERGIDAVLAVRTAAGPDGRPQSASVRLNSTYSAKVIGGVAWQNGWGGQAGSMADRTMRKDVIEAAREIADVLVKAIRR
jgi:hypothetical protein